jgi:hypothetical protein
LRIDNLPDLNTIKVLDLFSGEGLIWDMIKKQTKKDIKVLRVDQKKNKKGLYLIGDNLKYQLNYNHFDVIDIDAYGVPHRQLERIFQTVNTPTVLYITYIQTLYGGLPKKMLLELGYTEKMINKIPTLFNTHAQKKLFQWLSQNGIKKVKYYCNENKRKTYLCISL